MSDLAGPAAEAVRRCMGRPATLGGGRLLAVEGPSGSGKTEFARQVRGAVPAGTTVRVVHLDGLYPGWDGLAAGVERVARDLLAPLAAGRPGRYRRYDWLAGRDAEWVEVPQVDLLVLEGVGAGGDASWGGWVTLLVWLEAAEHVRHRRGLARDGLGTEEQLAAWWRREDAWFAAHGTRERADLTVPNP